MAASRPPHAHWACRSPNSAVALPGCRGGGVLGALQRYRWPGNVRELSNVVERALVLGDGPVLELDDLPPELVHAAPMVGATGSPGPAPLSVDPAQIRTLAELEREAIEAALAATSGNKARAAALLGIDRTTLYRKLKDHTKG